MEKEKTVKIRLPRAAEGEETTRYVGLNGKGYRILKGETVEVSEAIAEILRNAELADDENDVFLRARGYRGPEMA